MKRVFLAICFLFMIGVFVNISKADDAQPSIEKAEELVKNTSDEALNFLKSQKGKEWDTELVEAKFKNILNKYFNIDYIAKAALGNYWKKTTATQKKEYLDVFEKNIVKVYSVRFKEYSDQIVEIEKSSVRGRGDITVFSKIVSGDGAQPPLDVDWRIRIQKDGSYKIIDLNVAGVSMLITQKNEYKSIIEQNGGKIDALINELKELIATN